MMMIIALESVVNKWNGEESNHNNFLWQFTSVSLSLPSPPTHSTDVYSKLASQNIRWAIIWSANIFLLPMKLWRAIHLLNWHLSCEADSLNEWALSIFVGACPIIFIIKCVHVIDSRWKTQSRLCVKFTFFLLHTFIFSANFLVRNISFKTKLVTRRIFRVRILVFKKARY